MTESLLTRVKSRLYLRARRPATHLLDGEYASLHRGRSLDFADLRDYVPGDEVDDIDWKATARTGAPLVRRYVADRRHRVAIVVDGGRNFAADSAAGECKRDLAIAVAGTLGWLALTHGDEVSLITGDTDGIEATPFRSSADALDHALHRLDDRIRLDGPRSDVLALCERVRTTVRHRTLLVLIVDELPLHEALLRCVGTLAAQHEVLWVELADAAPLASGRRARTPYDVDGSWALPGLLRGDRRLRDEMTRAQAQRAAELASFTARHRISFGRVAREDEVVPVLLDLLKARQYGRH